MFKFTLKDVAVNKRTINPYAGLPKKGSLFRIHPDNFIQSYVCLLYTSDAADE